MTDMTTDVTLIELDVLVSAPPNRVWRALVHEVDAWWPADFRVYGAESRMELEPHAGGRLFERKGASELLWGHVIRLDQERMLQFAGHLAPEFGGPAVTINSVTLVADGDITRLTLKDSVFGRADTKRRESLESGWKYLYETGLRDYVTRSGS